MPTKSIDLPELMERFHTEDKCRAYLEDLRWPNGLACLRCGDMSVSRIQTRRTFECNSCRYQFSVRTDTILHDSKLPLSKWLLAVFIMVESKKGVSANQMKRMIGVSYKTSWFLAHRIRNAMGQVVQAPLSGTVEVDETFIGGKPKYKQGQEPARDSLGRIKRGRRPASHPQQTVTVIGAIERGGEVRLKVAPTRRKKALDQFMAEHIADDAEAIYTDSWTGYRDIADESTVHESVNHSAKEWVRGDVHTNSIENVWSLFKRSIVGSYHKLSEKHLPAYLDEMEWRFNNRDNPYLFRDTLKALLTADPLEYRELVAD